MDALTSATKLLFISYSRRQTARSDELYAAIDERTPYYRWRDNKIPTAGDWWDSICTNIEGCFAVVALLTPDYVRSVHCMAELDYALRLNKPVIALVENLEPELYPKNLRAKRIQFTRIDGMPIADVINHLQAACLQVMEDYRNRNFSPDISTRPYLRPPGPQPISIEQYEAEVIRDESLTASSELTYASAVDKPVILLGDVQKLVYIGAVMIDPRQSGRFAGIHCDKPSFTRDVPSQLNWVFDVYGVDLEQADTVNLLTQHGLWHYNPQQRCTDKGNWPLTFQKQTVGDMVFYRLYAAPHPHKLPLDDQYFEVEINGQKVDGLSITISWE